MITLQNVTWQAAVLGRWTARILGTLAVLLFLALVFGEGPPNPFALTLRENLSFLCMTALFLGLGLAWYREGWGGALTVAAFAALVLISRSHLHMPALQYPTAIGALHLICWSRLRAPAPEHVVSLSPPRGVIFAGSVVMGVFLLLCANEIFGNPPLMTPSASPGTALAGTWSSGDTVIAIHADGAVTGAITGKIAYNRTWFGRLMHWRGEYLVQGTTAGRPFVAALDLRDAELTGWHLHLRRIQ
jgi:hypothetical protein